MPSVAASTSGSSGGGPGVRGARFARYQLSDAVSAPGRDKSEISAIACSDWRKLAATPQPAVSCAAHDLIKSGPEFPRNFCWFARTRSASSSFQFMIHDANAFG
jgi:hypothetical protein